MSIDDNEEDGAKDGDVEQDGLGLLTQRSTTDDPNAGVGARDLLRPQSDTAADTPEAQSEPAESETSPAATTDEANAESGTTTDESQTQADFDSDLDGEAESARSSTWHIRSTARTADDPLLGCLTILCKLLDRPVSADALTAGLPLVDGRVTPPLFVRAASRVGIAAQLTQAAT